MKASGTLTRRAWLVAAMATLAGCLLRTTDPPRFFQPRSAMLEADAADDSDPPAAGGVPIRLRGVRSEPFLHERIVWRVSEVEYGFYDQRRWIDLPAHYVERALAARLRATPGLRLTGDPRAAALHVDLLAFDEMIAPAHAASVVLAVALDDPTRGRILARTFSVRAPIADGDPGSMAQAMGQALDEAVGRVADAVNASTLPARPR